MGPELPVILILRPGETILSELGQAQEVSVLFKPWFQSAYAYRSTGHKGLCLFSGLSGDVELTYIKHFT